MWYNRKENMKFKYLSISGKEIESEMNKSKKDLLACFMYRKLMNSMTPIVEIEGKPFWKKETAWGTLSKEEWIKNICPMLMEKYN